MSISDVNKKKPKRSETMKDKKKPRKKNPSFQSVKKKKKTPPGLEPVPSG